MNVGIIGGGAIGLLIAAHLYEEHEVSLYVRREEQRDKLVGNGICCSSLPNNAKPATHLFAEQKEEHDLVIITVKQHHISTIIDNLKSEAPLLFLQNGMNHLDRLPCIPNPCLVGVVEHGAIKDNDSTVRHKGRGRIQLAAHHGIHSISNWAERLSTDKFPFLSKDDYYTMLAKKLVTNTVINPLTALFQVKNIMVIENPSIQLLAKKLCKEACQALDLTFLEEWEHIISVATNTGDNQSSMLRDIMAGRETEVDAICGYVARLPHTESPHHEFVTEAIHALEFQYHKGETL
ncbi:2-dehydropantoate 2-reductase [Halobacillus shinanisalinarum]|uniref:2-dehydropantoate 2-reductase n=1 Tax=Halobacillus shinanisalinarum TaxID=2932258 RepID=A0ABY4GYW4_9BACI|nr:2-dehydropantoate 2-reductase [Halobacillus shinanisalinarum]UOQ93074.1 2-dehydropantoate 2-reductase [Halobacillus shinanisalinarum]